MAHPLVDKIVKEGVDSVNVSMLSKDLKKALLTEAGNVLMHEGRYAQAAKAFAVGENHDMLREEARWFMQQQRPAIAAWFLLYVEEKQEVLQELAQTCIAVGDFAAAKAIYEKLGDETMLLFLKENFGV